MAIDDILGVFGGGKRDKEAAERFYSFMTDNFKQILDNQGKLMNRLNEISEALETLSSKVEEMQAPKGFNPDIQIEDYTPPTYSSPSGAPSFQEQAPAAAPAPAPFFAGLEGNIAIPADDDMKENAFIRVVPTSADKATVEFNSLCEPMCISMGPSFLEDIFDLKIDSKDFNSIMPENTTTAHLEGGEWIVDGKIRLRLV